MPRLTLLWLVVAAFLMLTPGSAPNLPQGAPDPFCIVCGWRTVSDAILNVAFFLPLGWSLRRAWGWRKALALALAISLSVEIAQLLIPGRITSITDVVSNALGAVLGAWLAFRERKILPVMAFGAVLAVLAPLLLLAPAAPEGVYYGQWTARFADMTPYEGRVLGASIDGIEVPSRRSERTRELRRALGSGAPIDIEFVAGPAPDGLAPVFSVFDARRRRIFLLGVEDRDAVVHRWTRATDLRLDSPEIRWPRMLDGVESGDTLDLRLTRGDSGLCLTIDERTRCDTTPGVGAGWTLLLSPDGLSPPTTALAGVLWMLLMGALIGLPGGSPRLRLTLVGALTVVIMAVSANLPYMRGSLPQAGALFAGTVLGLLIRRRIGVR